MIYLWGLVKSGPGKNLASMYGRHEDQCIFWPSYGNLGGHLLTRNNRPILLLSASCRPVAVEAIKISLRLQDSNIDILRGELTRPEIRIGRVPMKSSMASCHDLIKVFPSSNDVPDAQVVSWCPGGTIACLQWLLKLNIDGIGSDRHGTQSSRQFFKPNKPFFSPIYHSCTGKQDKLDCIEDFSKGIFPVFSCTMALGLDQNWKRVQMVVHMGRGDPASII
jgi:superfamily II DNA helicase RecQ